MAQVRRRRWFWLSRVDVACDFITDSKPGPRLLSAIVRATDPLLSRTPNKGPSYFADGLATSRADLTKNCALELSVRSLRAGFPDRV
jgi:hypothetical protein